MAKVDVTTLLKKLQDQSGLQRIDISAGARALTGDSSFSTCSLEDLTQTEIELEILVAIDGWLQRGDDTEDVERSLRLMLEDLTAKEKEAVRLLRYDVHAVGIKKVQEMVCTLLNIHCAVRFLTSHFASNTKWYHSNGNKELPWHTRFIHGSTSILCTFALIVLLAAQCAGGSRTRKVRFTPLVLWKRRLGTLPERKQR